MGFKCAECNESYKDGPEGSLVHECKKGSLNYRVTRDGKPIAGHNHPTLSFVVRDKSTSATEPDTAESKRPKKKKH